MGKLLIFVAIIMAAIIALGLLGLWLENRKTRTNLGLKNTKERIEELETSTARQTDALRSIRELAEANAVIDPVFDLIASRATEALKDRETK